MLYFYKHKIYRHQTAHIFQNYFQNTSIHMGTVTEIHSWISQTMGTHLRFLYLGHSSSLKMDTTGHL